MMVMMTAMTPSLKASIRLVCIELSMGLIAPSFHNSLTLIDYEVQKSPRHNLNSSLHKMVN